MLSSPISACLAQPTHGGYLCDQIEGALVDYFSDDDYDFTLYRLMGLTIPAPMDMDHFVARTRSFHGMYDVHDVDERHEMACHLASELHFILKNLGL